MINFEKDFFEKYYYIWGHIIISESLGNDKHYLESLKLDLFVKVYGILGHSIIIEIFWPKCNYKNSTQTSF